MSEEKDLIRSNFPIEYTQFTRKVDAQFDGDPNGDFVMAKDVNELQEAIENIEQTIGLGGGENSIAEQIDKHLSPFGSPQFVYFGGVTINTYPTIEERINALSYIPHLVLRREDFSETSFLLQNIRATTTDLYGRVDCTFTGTLDGILSYIDWFSDREFTGVYLEDFDYSSGSTRPIQNQLLDYVHEKNMIAIITGDIDTTIFNAPHINNPTQEDLRILEGDVYAARNIFISNGEKNEVGVINTHIEALQRAQSNRNLRIFVEDTADGTAESTQNLYAYGKYMSTLFNIDAYGLAPTSRYVLGEKIRMYLQGLEIGKWKSNNPIFVNEGNFTYRTLSKGLIIYDKTTNDIRIEGIGLSPVVYTWENKQVPGQAVDLDSADITYTVVQSIVDRINSGEALISSSAIEGLGEGGLSASNIAEVVVRAINTSAAALAAEPVEGYEDLEDQAGDDFIHGRVIDWIDAGSIRTGTLDIEHIRANVIEAINAYIGTAVIDGAFIGELHAYHITAAVVDAINMYAQNAEIGHAVIDQAVIGALTVDHIQAAVIDAINLNAGHATIDSAVIGALDAEHIWASVIEALDIYAQNMTAESATINNAVIGELEAHHITASVIEAINAYIGEAVIDGAFIGDLSAAHISASVVDAINIHAQNMEVGSAVIDTAAIGELTAGHIQAEVIEAINASISEAVIESARVGELEAQHITAAVVEALNIYAENMEVGSATIDTALIGTLSADHISAEIIQAINASIETATIDNAKIGELDVEHITAAVIDAINLHAGTATIDSAVIGQLSAEHIKAEVIQAINASFETATIDSARIGELSAEHITAEVVRALNMYAENMEVGSARISSAVIDELTADHIQTHVIEAINASISMATIDAARISSLTADHIGAAVIEVLRLSAETGEFGEIRAELINAINAAIETAFIDGAIIGEGTISGAHIAHASITDAHIINVVADKITAGTLDAGEVTIINLRADSITTGSLTIDGDNLIRNSDFRDELEHWESFDGWSTDSNETFDTSGSVTASNGFIASESVQATRGAFVATAFFKANNTDNINKARIGIEWLDESMQRIALSEEQIGFVSGQWIRALSTGWAPPETHFARFVVAVEGTEQVWFTRALLQRGNIASEWKPHTDELLNDDSIGNNHLQQDSVGRENIIAGSVVAEHIVAEAVTSEHIRAQAVNAQHIQAGSITAESAIIAEAAILEANIAELQVTDAHIRDLTVDKLTAGSLQITSRNLLTNAGFRGGTEGWTFDSGLTIGRIDELNTLNGTSSVFIVTTGQSSSTRLGITSSFCEATPGEYLSASTFFMTPNVSEYGGSYPQIRIEYYNDIGLISTIEGHVATGVTINNNVWYRIFIIAEAPEGTTRARIKMYHFQDGETYFVRPMLQRGKVVTEWSGDGSFMTEDGVYTGTLHADQIVAGVINANHIEVGAGTTFAPGFSPDEIRNELQNEIDDSRAYILDVISSDGTFFTNGNVSTTLSALIRRGNEDITDSIEASRIQWIRISGDSVADAIWNMNHSGVKAITLTKDDVLGRASFQFGLT